MKCPTPLLLMGLLPLVASQYCHAPDSTGTVSCGIPGPAAGTFFFPPGVDRVTIVSMSSGNGGDESSFIKGGRGVQTTGTAVLPVTPAGLRYFVGDNGVTVAAGSGKIGPPRSGGSTYGATGGGPSFILDTDGTVLLSLGAGGGGGECGRGGDAGFGDGLNTAFPGSDGVNALCSNSAYDSVGQGGAGLNEPGRGGADNEDGPGQDGQPDGTGGDATPAGTTGGGGGSITGAAGGGSAGGAGGGGNSYSAIEGIGISPRPASDASRPALYFTYKVPVVTAATTTSLSTVRTSTTLATVTSSVTSLLTSTLGLVSTVQSPLSTKMVTVSTDATTIVTGRRTKARIDSAVTIMGPATTITAVVTSTMAPSCAKYQAVYPAECCPAPFKSMPRVPGTKFKRRDLNDPQRRSIDLHNEARDLEKRVGSIIVSSTASGPSLVPSTSGVATPGLLTLTETLSAPTTTAFFTSYTPTVTSISFTDVPADTTTITEVSSNVLTRTAVPGTTMTVINTITSRPSASTVTSTAVAQATGCATLTAFTVSSSECPAVGNNPQFQKFKKDQLGALARLQDQSSAAGSGRQILVNCGSAGTYYF